MQTVRYELEMHCTKV